VPLYGIGFQIIKIKMFAKNMALRMKNIKLRAFKLPLLKNSLFYKGVFYKRSLFGVGLATGLWQFWEMEKGYMGECQGSLIGYDNPNVKILDHKMIPVYVSKLRDPECGTEDFRHNSDKIMRLLIEEVLSHEPMKITKKMSLTGGEYDHYELEHTDDHYCAITVIRAGDSMLHTMFSFLPGIAVGKVLVQRDESSKDKHPIYYYSKLPKSIAEKKRIFILDPMVGTGGSCSVVVEELKARGVEEKNVTFINLISCPEGLDFLTKKFPEMKIVTAVLDPKMNEDLYITPGIGDFGDRYFNSN
jgi:uracil phosphoribosyltransferase